MISYLIELLSITLRCEFQTAVCAIRMFTEIRISRKTRLHNPIELGATLESLTLS